MSLYLVPAGVDEARLQSVAREFRHAGKSEELKPGPAGWLWVDDAPERFGPAYDPATGVRVVSSGRLAWSAIEWARAARLLYTGGLANRLVLHRYLNGGPSAVTPYNGAVVVAIHDPRDGRIHIWTDQFGYHPCFLYRGENSDKCIVTTFPDALLADLAVRLTPDLVTMAEFVRGWRGTPPNTYFNEIKHVGAATHVVIDTRAGRVSRRAYWKPFEDEFFPSIGAATDELASAVRAAIAERTSIAQRPLFFVSGGADSRVLLFCAADRSRVTAVNLYERAATETDVARRLCAASGCTFVALQRDNDFYPRNLSNAVRWSGAMWSAEDAHYPGFSAQIRELEPDLVMTACTTDWLFKGYGLEKCYQSIFGRYLPFLRYTNERVDGFLPNVPTAAPSALAHAVDERMAAWFEGCPRKFATPRDRLLVEDRRVRPTAYAVSVSGQIMYRQFPYDSFLADSRIAECYSRVHPDWKLNRELWGRVAAQLCTGADEIIDANYGWRVDASMPQKALKFTVGWFGRRLSRSKRVSAADDHRPPSSGSWPDLGWYALHSPTLKRLWATVTPDERERIAAITGGDTCERPLSDWSRNGSEMFRLLTLLCHWRETDQRRKRAAFTSIVVSDI